MFTTCSSIQGIAIFHPPTFGRGRCNNLCNLGVHNMLIHISHCHLSSTHFWKGEMQQPMQPMCSQHAHPSKAIAIFHPPNFERGRCNNLSNQCVHNMLIHPKPLPSFIRGRCNNLCNLSVHDMLTHYKAVATFHLRMIPV
jgi:hypothetical protein